MSDKSESKIYVDLEKFDAEMESRVDEQKNVSGSESKVFVTREQVEELVQVKVNEILSSKLLNSLKNRNMEDTPGLLKSLESFNFSHVFSISLLIEKIRSCPFVGKDHDIYKKLEPIVRSVFNFRSDFLALLKKYNSSLLTLTKKFQNCEVNSEGKGSFSTDSIKEEFEFLNFQISSVEKDIEQVTKSIKFRSSNFLEQTLESIQQQIKIHGIPVDITKPSNPNENENDESDHQFDFQPKMADINKNTSDESRLFSSTLLENNNNDNDDNDNNEMAESKNNETAPDFFSFGLNYSNDQDLKNEETKIIKPQDNFLLKSDNNNDNIINNDNKTKNLFSSASADSFLPKNANSDKDKNNSDKSENPLAENTTGTFEQKTEDNFSLFDNEYTNPFSISPKNKSKDKSGQKQMNFLTEKTNNNNNKEKEEYFPSFSAPANDNLNYYTEQSEFLEKTIKSHQKDFMLLAEKLQPILDQVPNSFDEIIIANGEEKWHKVIKSDIATKYKAHLSNANDKIDIFKLHNSIGDTIENFESKMRSLIRELEQILNAFGENKSIDYSVLSNQSRLEGNQMILGFMKNLKEIQKEGEIKKWRACLTRIAIFFFTMEIGSRGSLPSVIGFIIKKILEIDEKFERIVLCSLYYLSPMCVPVLDKNLYRNILDCINQNSAKFEALNEQIYNSVVKTQTRIIVALSANNEKFFESVVWKWISFVANSSLIKEKIFVRLFYKFVDGLYYSLGRTHSKQFVKLIGFVNSKIPSISSYEKYKIKLDKLIWEMGPASSN